jgi:hypothetical protein
MNGPTVCNINVIPLSLFEQQEDGTVQNSVSFFNMEELKLRRGRVVIKSD